MALEWIFTAEAWNFHGFAIGFGFVYRFLEIKLVIYGKERPLIWRPWWLVIDSLHNIGIMAAYDDGVEKK